MSQMTVPARLGQVGIRPARLPAFAARRTRVQDAAPVAGHFGFMILCLALVMATFSAVLVLNTARAEGSYVMSRLQTQQTELHDTLVTLQSELDDLQSSEALAMKARKLKMVPSTSTATLRLSDGSLTGVASMVDGNRTITVDLPSTGVAVKDQ
ncbi:MAG: hypothetical protein Q4P07_10450 [Ornithinimicrobium sp.]|uniref:hypothetical protein n=1 Tax=Ornithinimicrobium sp. TaxID=1977084 RepID=UPI0026E05C6D|nr:hypothetical protein [Ornithinimicrobium sp.]MDO5740555.1 hypothetical protein [Ornithinimicrobium sp.]